MDSQQRSTPSSRVGDYVQPDDTGCLWRRPVLAPCSDFDGNRPLTETPLPTPLGSSLSPTQGSPSTTPSHQCEPAAPAQEAFRDAYTLTLAGGYVLKYSEADFQDIPSTSGIFSDPCRLAAVWDDASPLWGKKEYSPLIVQNILIAIKHWKQFYRQFQKVENQICWNNWRQNWYNYQDLMNEYQSLGDAAFKGKWSNALCSSKILSVLRGQRKQDWDHLAKVARLEYPGDAFEACFAYKKNGEWIVPRQSKAIAKRYMVLKGIAT